MALNTQENRIAFHYSVASLSKKFDVIAIRMPNVKIHFFHFDSWHDFLPSFRNP